jgi:UDP-N-acetylmuramoyl-L-alanine---L-glutamate ligase
MTFNELSRKSVLILGLGTEGRATYEFLRKKWPTKRLRIADQTPIKKFPRDLAQQLQSDPAVHLELGPSYLDSLTSDTAVVIIKTPGIPASLPQIKKALDVGCILTSHSELFLANSPRERVIGVTGTKGKSTTTSLIHHILIYSGIAAELVGNIGNPPLMKIDAVPEGTYFVHEFSSHQLAEVHISPHIAVLLNIVPEHLDYYSTFEQYVAAKENITRFQNEADLLVFNADYPIPTAIAQRTKAQRRPFSVSDRPDGACYVDNNNIVCSFDGEETILALTDIPLPGAFNVQNVIAAVAVARLCEVPPGAIREAVRSFRPLPHRLEPVGIYQDISFYDDSIATVPEATLAALQALGGGVQTLILGGHERHLDFTELGAKLPQSVRTVILFPATGLRIWAAIERHSPVPPQPFFVESMEEAVRIAYARTETGKICLLSPASPSFGMFKDYQERGNAFKRLVMRLGGETPDKAD